MESRSKDIAHKILTRVFHAPIVTRRTSTKGGVIVAVLGVDGSGKSTIISEVSKSLSKKLDVLPLYLGSGDGKASILRQPLIWLARVKKSRSTKSPTVDKASTEDNLKSTHKKSLVSQLYRLLWTISLTYEKQNKLKQAYQARDRGIIVICDRYPQSQILGFNDGPLLTSEAPSSKVLQTFQRWNLNLIKTWQKPCLPISSSN